jgi:hypothetical protein
MDSSKYLLEEEEVVMGPEIVSLQDPISLARIQIPVRGNSCKHSACFDLATFIRFVKNLEEHGKCPFCDSSLLVDDLYVDPLFKLILRDCKQNHAAINPDGSWASTKMNKGSSRKRKAADSEPINVVESLGDTLAGIQHHSSKKQNILKVTNNNRQGTRNTCPEVIFLGRNKIERQYFMELTDEECLSIVGSQPRAKSPTDEQLFDEITDDDLKQIYIPSI